MTAPVGARADSLVYMHTPGNVVGQTSNNPCIIGEPSCDANTKQTFIAFQCSKQGKGCVAVDDLVSSFTLVNENNGTGWADGFISQINLVNGDYYKFEAVWHNDSDGMEQFWIIPGSATTAVPEPGTLSLLGAGLLCVAIGARKAGAVRV